ncbi:hypothetical protein CcaverHIS002_0303540 [Cutaneotrichosporon cavernicola]|uniref:DUF218 domain-containing protein n=1 Tax=Cutaneotrichosporon cavernicola TaxID=279322 RepID=A0AA48IGP1_9TREE|nr:uncharacterized protein CcaverHIS019_0303530 [Cutaneotrichosporon cavernicola]BEI82486.1 hypothetical protein CcaverHIS002_0303540 [Cutaneotrichosporon cavernicola]BEI90283.1 hypothetical protein CcaverHIS019_0303530 [Cutaneotrichosporon cavernicola]BEI98059.1 hypothetical protein CcaverHIS631_0303580 [Cutaneotrichosporon cavernicola]BEJ05836.1 hypothetical protein CcaverHIS641_0303580 [Cutaneotrichosporon cavernicola]
MLPLPSGTRHKPRYAPVGAYSSYSSPLTGSVMGVLRTRSRLTNLAVALILLFLSLSLLANLRSLASGPPHPHFRWHAAWDELADADILDSGRPPSVETTIKRDPRMVEVDHLILVPGHAVWLGSDVGQVGEDGEWVLEGMQKGGSVGTYIKHIEKGANMAADDPNSLLVFSGGATRVQLTSPLSEGASYHRLAAAKGLLDTTGSSTHLPLSARATTEEFALDSYENLLFSMARFREVTGHWPSQVTVVGYGMKQHRFEQLHRGAIRFPADRFSYVGIDDMGDTRAHYEGELKYGYAPFLFAPSGCRPPLATKRANRNPFARYPPYHSSTPELAALLEWCPPSTPIGDVAVPTTLGESEGMEPPAGFVVYDGKLPWDGLKRWNRERD